MTRLEQATLEAAIALLQADPAHAWAALALLEDSAPGPGATAIGLLRRAQAADKARRVEGARHLRAQAEAALLAGLAAATTDAAA